MCEQALGTLAEHGLLAEEIDIDHEETLRQKFDTCVPVVEIDGKVRFRGRVDPRLLRRLIQHAGGTS